MDDKKEFSPFLKYYILYIIFIIATVSVAILSYVFIQSQWVYLLIFSLMFFLLILSFRFKKKLYLIIHQNYIDQIRKDVIDPIDLKPTVTMVDIQKKLNKQGYQLYYTDQTFVVLTKIEKDIQIRKVFQHHILFVAVVHFDSNNAYYQEKVDVLINDIQFKSQTEDKKRIDRLLISQYKEVQVFDEKEKESINEIIFIKTDKHIVSTINVGIVNNPKIALMLAAKTYRPSSYYDLHLNSIFQSLQ